MSIPRRDGELPTASLNRWLVDQTASWLLVYDNAESRERLQPYVLGGAHVHHVLITSRSPGWRGVATPLELNVWTPMAGRDFLLSWFPDESPEDCEALSMDLAGLPLALEQAAGYLDINQSLRVRDYRALLAEVGTAALEEGGASTGYEHTVVATLSLVFQRLTAAARRLLSLLGYAAPEPFPERFFREASEQLPEDLRASAKDTLAWNRVVSELLGYGLIQRQSMASLSSLGAEETADGTELGLTAHRLTQQVVRARLADRAVDGRALQAVLRVCTPHEANLPVHWPRYAVLTPHVLQLDEGRWDADGDEAGLSELLDRVASYLQFGPARYEESESWLRRALAIARSVLGEEHPDTLTRMNNLALTLNVKGDRSGARALQEDQLSLSRRVQGEEHPETLRSMANLAVTLNQQGDWSGARALEEAVLPLSRRVLGEEHPETLTSMANLAMTLYEQGDLSGARALEEAVLPLSRRVLGEEHPDTLRSMANLAATLKQQGDWSGARALEEAVLPLRRRVLGEAHPETLISKHNLATTLWQQGHRSEAKAMLQEAVDGAIEVLGPVHPHTRIFEKKLKDWLG